MIDEIEKKFNEKKQKISNLIANNSITEDEKNDLLKKISLIEELLTDKTGFNNINMKAAFSILEFLEISENEILNVYLSLIDPKNNDDVYLLVDRSK